VLFAALVIAPDVATVGLLDFARFGELVESGRKATRRAIETGGLDAL
jgi:predicted acylesterase/phospholipase RssA